MPSMPPCPPTTSRLNCSSFLQRLMLLWCYSYGLQCLLRLADVYLRGYFSTLYDNSVIFGGLYACFTVGKDFIVFIEGCRGHRIVKLTKFLAFLFPTFTASYSCKFLRKYSLLLNRRHVSTNRQGEFWKPKVCNEKIYTNSSADNSASRHDSLNLKGSAESGEEND